MNLSSIIDRMIIAGLSPGEAGAIAAEIYAAGVASVISKSTGAQRQQRYRERNKASQSVTTLRSNEASQSVTERNEPSRCDALQSAPLTKEDKKIEIKKEKKEATRGTRLPETWIPSEANIACALAKNLSRDRIDAEGRKFRNYWAAKSGQGATKVNWNLTWENWIDSTIEREGQQNGHRTGNTRTTGHDAILAVAARKARELDRQDPMAGTADTAGFAFGDGIDRSGPQGDRSTAGSDQRDHHGVEPDDQRIREGEIIPPDKNAAGFPGRRQFV